MKTLKIYQIDAFAEKAFTGNPAAVCPLEEWLPDELMQKIAMENNLAETAFYIPEGDGFHLRWFTPAVEVDLCGHATLATAHVLFEHLNYTQKVINFQTRSGLLQVEKKGEILKMNFPVTPFEKTETPQDLIEGLGIQPLETYKSDDYLLVVESEEIVQNLQPNLLKVAEVEARGVMVTAPGKEVDFISRFFAPQSGINEDPVTGSAHTVLIPYWAKKLGKTELTARQISPRGGNLFCTLVGDRVEISGKAITYLIGEIFVP